MYEIVTGTQGKNIIVSSFRVPVVSVRAELDKVFAHLCAWHLLAFATIRVKLNMCVSNKDLVDNLTFIKSISAWFSSSGFKPNFRL